MNVHTTKSFPKAREFLNPGEVSTECEMQNCRELVDECSMKWIPSKQLPVTFGLAHVAIWNTLYSNVANTNLEVYTEPTSRPTPLSKAGVTSWARSYDIIRGNLSLQRKLNYLRTSQPDTNLSTKNNLQNYSSPKSRVVSLINHYRLCPVAPCW